MVDNYNPPITEEEEQEMAQEAPEEEHEEEIDGVPSVVRNLQKWSVKTNIADEIEQDVLDKIGQDVCQEYAIDLESRSDWERNAEESLKLASMVADTKDYPWPNPSNIIYPLVSQGAVQFASRTYPTIIREGMVVKGKVMGEKTDEKIARADRVGDFMSYQLLEKVDGWAEDMDSLLHYFSVVGLAFKKTYWCVEEEKPVSEFLRVSDVVVHYWTKSLKKALRITHRYEITPNEYETRRRTKEYLDVDLGEVDPDDENTETIVPESKEPEQVSLSPYEILEQSRWYDLDEDGYAEPYNVFVHKKTQKVLRITARFEADDIAWNEDGEITYIQDECFYTKFVFMPSIDGSFYSMGLGTLLGHTNEMINSIINQMIDAGTLQNCGGGIASDDLEIFGKNEQTGNMVLRPGEYMIAHDKGSQGLLRDKFMPFNHQGPSIALFSLLEMIINSGERLGMSVEVLSGEQTTANEPATSTLAKIDQATKPLVAVRERLFVSLREEFRKIQIMNRRHLEDMDYNRMLDDNVYQIAKADFQDKDCDVIPVANPADVTDAQMVMKAVALREFLQVRITTPQEREAGRLYLKSLQIEDAEKYLPTDEQMSAPPPEVVEKQNDYAMEQSKLYLDEMRLEVDKVLAKAQILERRAKSINLLADAEAKELGSQMDGYKVEIEAIKATAPALQPGKPGGQQTAT